MDVERLAKRYRGRVTFWGEIDPQRLRNPGTPDEFREAVLAVRKALDYRQRRRDRPMPVGAGRSRSDHRRVLRAMARRRCRCTPSDRLCRQAQVGRMAIAAMGATSYAGKDLETAAAPVAQGIEQRISNPLVAGSNPAGRAWTFTGR